MLVGMNSVHEGVANVHNNVIRYKCDFFFLAGSSVGVYNYTGMRSVCNEI